MIRLTWMAFRTQGLVGLAALLVVGVVLLVTGPHLVHLYDTNVVGCAAHFDCSSATGTFLKNDHGLVVALNVLVVVVPGLVGIFWGAPLVARELETGTYRLAWTQSVSRARWLAVKLGVVGLAAALAGGVLSLMVTWWSSPVDRANVNLFATFDQRDLVPVGAAAFAFAVGTTAGVLLRRTIPAMAATLVTFAGARLLGNYLVLPRLVAPLRHSYALVFGTTINGYGGPPGQPQSLFAGLPNLTNAWVLSSDITDRAGHPLTAGVVSRTCPGLAAVLGGPGPGPGAPVALNGGHAAVVGRAPAGANQALVECVRKVGLSYREYVTYQPAGHYWPLQWAELALFLVVAVALGGICLWRIRRHLS
ncbi:MAG: transporter [Acidimicrobiales bacterium]